jgi:hypothetical protein
MMFLEYFLNENMLKIKFLRSKNLDLDLLAIKGG